MTPKNKILYCDFMVLDYVKKGGLYLFTYTICVCGPKSCHYPTIHFLNLYREKREEKEKKHYLQFGCRSCTSQDCPY